MRLRQFYQILLMECSNIMAGNTNCRPVDNKAAENEELSAKPPKMSYHEERRKEAAERRAYLEKHITFKEKIRYPADDRYDEIMRKEKELNEKYTKEERAKLEADEERELIAETRWAVAEMTKVQKQSELDFKALYARQNEERKLKMQKEEAEKPPVKEPEPQFCAIM